jgi:hypothetical protein
MGKLKTTKYVVKFDILKTEQVASAQKSFDGGTLGQMAGLLGAFSGSRGGAAAGAVGGTAIGSVHSGEATSVWVIGMRYKIIDAETTEQLAQGYTEEKMEVGATASGALGANESQQGAPGLDTMVQRLVQKVRVGNRREVQVTCAKRPRRSVFAPDDVSEESFGRRALSSRNFHEARLRERARS